MPKVHLVSYRQPSPSVNLDVILDDVRNQIQSNFLIIFVLQLQRLVHLYEEIDTAMRPLRVEGKHSKCTCAMCSVLNGLTKTTGTTQIFSHSKYYCHS